MCQASVSRNNKIRSTASRNVSEGTISRDQGCGFLEIAGDSSRRWFRNKPPDGLHPGAAADADGRQAEAVSGEPAANHAENDIVIRGARIKSSLDFGGWQAGDLYYGTWVNK